MCENFLHSFLLLSEPGGRVYRFYFPSKQLEFIVTMNANVESSPVFSNKNNSLTSLQRQAKNEAKSRFCSICNAEARIINYGVLSCYSCKTFFRRHCSRTKKVNY